METQERAKRFNKKLMVSVGGNSNSGINLLGVTSNISTTGICLVTDKILPLNEDVTILIAAEGEIYSLAGEAIWNSTYPDTFIGTGISVTSNSPDYVGFVNKINYH